MLLIDTKNRIAGVEPVSVVYKVSNVFLKQKYQHNHTLTTLFFLTEKSTLAPALI